MTDGLTIKGPDGVVTHRTPSHVAIAATLGTAPSPAVKGMLWYDPSGSPGLAGTIAYVAKTSNYTVTDSDTAIKCDASGGAFTITLPTAVGRIGKVFMIKKVDSSANPVTIDGDGSETIDGSLTIDLTIENEARTLMSDGANWGIW